MKNAVNSSTTVNCAITYTLCTFRSIPVEPPHSHIEGYEEEEGSSEGGEGVPVELLERASRTSSSVGYSHSEEEGEEFALQEGKHIYMCKGACTTNDGKLGGAWEQGYTCIV